MLFRSIAKNKNVAVSTVVQIVHINIFVNLGGLRNILQADQYCAELQLL